MNRIFPTVRYFGKDLRFSIRQFRRAPGYAVFTVLVLSLGIGTVTAMFTICYGIFLKPLPFQADRQLFLVVERDTKGEEFGTSYAEITQWQQATNDSADVAFSSGGVNILDAPAGAELVSSIATSSNLFSILGVQPMMGRTFSASEQVSDQPNVVVLSYAIWQRGFGGERNILGKTVQIGGIQHTIIGIMPKGFEYPVYQYRAEVWVPLDRSTLTPVANDPYGAAYFTPLVRLHAGVRPEVVEAEVANAHAQFLKHGEKRQTHLLPLRDLLVRDVRPALLALVIAVIVVWLIACSNVAGLMLARVAVRRSEIAIRSALGASRRRIVSQFLAESLLLSVAGAAGGAILATTILRTFKHLLMNILPLAQNIEMNWAVWLALVTLTLMTALAFGTVPALIGAWTGSAVGLRNSGQRHAGDRGQNRLRQALLIGEVALSIALLIAAGLMMRTMYALRHVPLGFRTDHLLVTNLTAPSDLYKNQNVGSAAWQPLLDAVKNTPGVEGAAFSTVIPLKHPIEWLTVVYKTDWTQDNVNAEVRAATPGLMEVLGVGMRRGRFFNEGDTASSQRVTVVNREFVNRYLGGGDPIGKQIRFGRTPINATIIGVIDDIHQDAVSTPSKPEFYVCMRQVAIDNPLYRPLLSRYMELVVRTEIQPDAVIADLRHKISETNPHLAIGDFSTMETAVEDSIGAQKLTSMVIGVFGALALLITFVGLYGLLSYVVEQRKREIGIRMALGANRGTVVAMVMRQTLLLTTAGVSIGLGIALWSNSLLRGFLYGVRTLDPWTFCLAPLMLIGCSVFAALIPARRAASVNPVDALRAE